MDKGGWSNLFLISYISFYSLLVSDFGSNKGKIDLVFRIPYVGYGNIRYLLGYWREHKSWDQGMIEFWINHLYSDQGQTKCLVFSPEIALILDTWAQNLKLRGIIDFSFFLTPCTIPPKTYESGPLTVLANQILDLPFYFSSLLP